VVFKDVFVVYVSFELTIICLSAPLYKSKAFSYTLWFNNVLPLDVWMKLTNNYLYSPVLTQDRQTDGQTGTQTDRHTYTQTHRQTHRQTDGGTHNIYLYIFSLNIFLFGNIYRYYDNTRI